MKKEWNTIEVLQHTRHDWLNVLQLIQGNLTLNRSDRVTEIINETIMSAKNESNLTNLKAFNLASLLITFNWESAYHFSLEYEVVGDVVDLSDIDQNMTEWFISFFQNLSEITKPFSENHLCITIDLLEKDVRFFLDFRGTIENKDNIVNWLEQPQTNAIIHIESAEVNCEEMSILLKIKR